ncbi:Re/Si-specific NAD(P)(+) transhydrogenase subunit alpha [Gallaecimonas mangrovi]|uniref:Re/Si-specific NAD(P)(+) transhydrogenase subunit alpha n=1 Tax=Gallaecimonas mangrovi TaxID=2291597 RepID=UPI000E20BC75|nr:Re/Si-specific NAD(P)(+) transhydrogenase subunit alpha [Gallaecimonas mangrovi]
MRIGIPAESLTGENRVAASPKSVAELQKLGFSTTIESGAGKGASFDDSAYQEAGAELGDAWDSDLVFKVNAPNDDEIARLKPGATLVSFIQPAQNPELIEKLNKQQVNVLAMDMVPRISRAQSLDALSSMANIAGYRAVVEAANAFGRFFTGQITAAGKVPPAKVLVIGAGVAGLAAIGAAGSLGAQVRAFDTRPEVKEQIQSMGADFLEVQLDEDEGSSSDGYAKEMSQAFIDAEMALFMEQAKEVDIIITTALIPGKPAPKLITRDMVKAMKPGSVIVDLAAPNGGNCELTKPGKRSKSDNGVVILGYTDLASRLAGQSSTLYATNLVNLAKLLCKEKDGNINIDFDDVVLRNMTVVKEGEVTFPPPAISVSAAPKPKPQAQAKPNTETEEAAPKAPGRKKYVLAALGLLAFAWVADAAPAAFLSHFTVFVLACVVGYYVVWNVTHSLHTPLMSVTNAISGIIVVGALLQAGSGGLTGILAFLAILVATVNIVGGFTVTRRMLKMFQKG